MSMDMSMEVGRMAALAEAVQREFESEVTTHGVWLIDLLNADLWRLKSKIDNDGSDFTTEKETGGAS